MKQWKEVIREGVHWYVDERTGQPRKLVVTKDGIKYLHDQGKAMLGANLSIPIPFEHQKSARPLTPEEKAANSVLHNAGWIEDYKVFHTPHGDRLFGLHNIEHPEAQKAIPKTIKYVSPWITSFTDGQNRKWEGVIGHVALTSRPRITSQQPFGSNDVAMSMADRHPSPALSPSALSWLPDEGLCVSRAGLLIPGGTDGAKLQPLFPMAFSLWAGAKFDLEDMKGKEKKPEGKDGKPPEKKEAEGKKPPPKEGEKGEKPTNIDGEMDGLEDDAEMTLHDILKEIVSALWGIDLPEGLDESNLGKHLLKGLMEQFKEQAGGMGGKSEAELAAPAPNNPPPLRNELPPNPHQQRGPVIQESPPMYMSLEEIQKITDPTLKQVASAEFSNRQKADKLEKRALSEALQKRRERIDRLLKRCKASGLKEDLDAMEKSATLSIADDGSVVDSLDVALGALERAATDIPSLVLSNISGKTKEEAHPEDAQTLSEARAEAVAAELEASAGLAQPKKQGDAA